MSSRNSSHLALSVCVAAALLAGCGGSQLPIGAPSSSAQLSRADRIGRHFSTTPSFQVLHKFVGHVRGSHNHSGANPDAGLLDVAGTLYGTTFDGGRGVRYLGFGLVYSISTSRAYKVLYRFGGFPRGDGQGPNADLINVNGTLYSTTQGEYGTIYSVTTAGIEKVLHAYSYRGTNDPGIPTGVVNVNGTLYGTAGPGSTGIFYSISTSGAYNVLYAFRGPRYGDGYGPDGELLNVNGTLYGVTNTGGTGSCTNSGCGTVYRVTTSGEEKVLYRFQGGSDGWGPSAGLIDVNGTLYGTTYVGGGSGCRRHFGCGTVYSISTSGIENVLYRFRGGSDGANPNASLSEMNGTLYGTTLLGGSAGDGTIFSISPSGSEQVVHSFSGSDGAHPNADLIVVNNVLYGTTAAAGLESHCGGKGCGTVFALTP